MWDPTQIGPLIDRFGVAVAVLVGFTVLVSRGTLRWGAGVDATTAAREAEFAKTLQKERDDRAAEMLFREQLRQEERAGRVEAENRLDEALEVAKQATDLSSRYERIVRQKLDEPG